jgi:hypothetical protein
VTTFCDPSQVVNRKDPGALADWLVLVVGVACFVTFIAVPIGTGFALAQIDRAADRGWLPYTLTYVTAFGVLAAWLPPAPLSRALRVAVLLPAVHALVVALAWPAWHSLARFADASTASKLVTDFPIGTVALVTITGFLVFAGLVARRRSGEWLHGFVMLALCELLLLGLWLPISCKLWPGGQADWWTFTEPVVTEVAPRVALTAIPPTVLALVFTALALRRPSLLLAWRRVVVWFVGVALFVAFASRLGASAREMVLYSNLLPMLLTAMIVAIAALLCFGVGLAVEATRAQAAFRRRKRSDGVIVSDDGTPAFGLQITSWLRGPRIVQRPFAVSIAGATIPISGAHLVAAMPAATTQLRTGEAYAVLRPGDRVTIAGHADAAGDPFRTSAAPLAGDVMIAPADRAPAGFAQVALAMWRPCVAYLLIVVAVAIPALAALAAA